MKKNLMLTESQKGKVAEALLAQTVILGSQGQVNVALPSVDDEAIDILFYLKGGSRKVMFAQVKSRWLSSVGINKGVFRTQVRRATFSPRDNYFLIFMVCDQDNYRLGETLWIVPSKDFLKLTSGQGNHLRIVFQSRFNSNDMWQKYRLTLKDLPRNIMELLRAK